MWAIFRRLDAIERNQACIAATLTNLKEWLMSSFDDLTAQLTGIATDVTSLQTGFTSLEATITSLQAQIANAGTTLPADAQTSLDSAVQQAGTLKSALDAMVASLPAAPPAAAPTA